MIDVSKNVFKGLRQSIIEKFEKEFGVSPFWVASAPSRVNLIGEHIDYCDGFVLPMAINRHVMIAAAPNGTSEANIASSLFPGEIASIMVDERPMMGEPKWANYIRGVLDGFRLKDLWPLPGFDAVIHSNIPLGAGLSSSAALEVAVATLVEGLLGLEINPTNKALLCQRAEQKFAGVPCGIMDQFSSIFAKKNHAVLIDCRSQKAQTIPVADTSLEVIIADTKIQHALSDGSYANRRKQTEIALSILGKDSWRNVSMEDLEEGRDMMSETVFQRARHVVTEIVRTQKAAMAMAHGKMDVMAQLMKDSHVSLRDDFEVSCKELDVMVEGAWNIGEKGGVLGSRMTGGGFGGSSVTIARGEEVESIMEQMNDHYKSVTGIDPHIFSSKAVDGTKLEEML